MIIALVRGTLVASVQANKVAGGRYLLVEPCSPEGIPSGQMFVALDTLSAARGEMVLVSSGSSARQTPLTKEKPVDAVIVGIVEIIEEKI